MVATTAIAQQLSHLATAHPSSARGVRRVTLQMASGENLRMTRRIWPFSGRGLVLSGNGDAIVCFVVVVVPSRRAWSCPPYAAHIRWWAVSAGFRLRLSLLCFILGVRVAVLFVVAVVVGVLWRVYFSLRRWGGWLGVDDDEGIGDFEKWSVERGIDAVLGGTWGTLMKPFEGKRKGNRK